MTQPAPHAYPAGHTPLQLAVVIPDTLPYVPALHGPLQLKFVRPGVAPYSPALQFVHDDAPATEYCPAGHIVAVDDTEPAGHAYPATHGPLHADDVNPDAAPYRPESHSPLHVGKLNALALP